MYILVPCCTVKLGKLNSWAVSFMLKLAGLVPEAEFLVPD